MTGRSPYGWTPEVSQHTDTAPDDRDAAGTRKRRGVVNGKDFWSLLAIAAAIVLFVILTR